MSADAERQPSRILLQNGKAVTGDGETLLPVACILIERGRIVDLDTGTPPVFFDGEVLDLAGAYLLPGFINHHAHGITTGPLFASAAAPLSREQARKHLDDHLRAGVTTLLNLDGFALPEEVEATAGDHPCRVFTASVHLPQHLQTAEAVDGEGLTERHRRFTLEEAADAGAVAVGEVGSGHTLGGGGQEYMYIPRAIEKETGRRIAPLEARRIKEACLGRSLEFDQADFAAVENVLVSLGLADVLSVERCVELVRQTVLPAYERAVEAMWEAAREALRLGLPLIVHNAAASRNAVARLAEDPEIGVPAGLRLIAGHSNHDTFTVEEAVTFGHWLKERDVVIDASTFDAFGARRTTESPEHLLAMAEEGLLDTLSTDYGAGAPDPMLTAVRELVRRGTMSLPAAVALCTANVARALPELGSRAGRIARGAPADVIWVEASLEQVRGVLVGGRRVL